MPFTKQMTLPNGAEGNYHKIINVSASDPFDKLQVQVGSWPSYEAYLEGRPAIWNSYIDINPGVLLERSEGLVLLDPQFAGSTVVSYTGTDLEKEKAKQWSNIKTFRDRKEFGGFAWDGSIFDSDLQSQSRIQGGVQLAIMAQQSGQPFTIAWTLQDNSVRNLNGTEMIEVGLALAAHVQSVHSTGRTLRDQIDSATTVEQVQQISWS